MNSAAVLWLGAAFVGFLVWCPIGASILLTLFATAVSQQLTGTHTQGVNTMNLKIRTPQFLSGSSGNSAFDEYRQETLRQLEADGVAFESFVDRLRRAKDRSEFDRFMEERNTARPIRPASRVG